MPMAEETAENAQTWDSADEKLLAGLRCGAEAAYEALIQRFQQPVYNLVYRLVDDPSEAADVTQEVFLKVFRKVGSFRGESSLKTWIYRIAVNQAYNQHRWFSRHRRQEIGLERTDENGLSIRDVLPDHCASPFDFARDRETHEIVEAALLTINPSFRSAVILRDLDDLSYEEIAEVLQVSLGTVKSRIMRGREALRRKLAGRMEMDYAPTGAGHGKL